MSVFHIPVAAQNSAPPPGISKEQFDALVEAIGQSVVEKLKAPAPAGTSVAPLEPSEVSTPDRLEQEVARFFDKAGAALRAFPDLVRRLAAFPRLIVEAGDGRGLSTFLLLLTMLAALAIAAERLTLSMSGGLRARLGLEVAAKRGASAILPIAALLAIDLIGVWAVWLVSYGAIGIWFSRGVGQDRLAAAILAGIFAWRLYMLAFRFVLRPGVAGARLVGMGSDEAKALYRSISLIIFVIMALRIVIRILIAIGTPAEVVAAAQIAVTSTVLALVFWMASRSRMAVGVWMAGLSSAKAGLAGWLGAHWLVVATPLFIALGLTQIYGAIVARYSAPNAVLLMLNALIALILFQTLARYLTRSDYVAAPHNPESEPAAEAVLKPVQRRFSDEV
ncbi:MAG: hypothetical protein EOP20_05565, partial [Hyphomicrobiales bacterium]